MMRLTEKEKEVIRHIKITSSNPFTTTTGDSTQGYGVVPLSSVIKSISLHTKTFDQFNPIKGAIGGVISSLKKKRLVEGQPRSGTIRVIKNETTMNL